LNGAAAGIASRFLLATPKGIADLLLSCQPTDSDVPINTAVDGSRQ
jgi:hypothetical protein